MMLLSILIDVSIKATVLLLLTAAAALALRRASAAARHLIWTAGILGVFLLPLMSWTLPAWRVLPAWTRWDETLLANPPAHHKFDTPTAISPPNSSPRTESLGPGALTPTTPDPEYPRDPHAGTQHPTTSALAAGELPPQSATPNLRQSPSPGPTLAYAILWLWAAGFACMLFPLALSWIALRRMTQRARPVQGPLAETLERLRTPAIRRPVRLLVASRPNTPAPLTCGILRPIILLPAEASEWTPQRQRLVLLHELAHIQRHDCLTLILARLARALLWFHPLVWIAAAQTAREAERASDDLVLAAGTRGSDYANELLNIAAAFQSHPALAAAALTMARPSTLESRLRGILDPAQNRRGLTRKAVLAAMLVAAGIMLPLAILRSKSPAALQSVEVVWRADSTGKLNLGSEVPRTLTLNDPSDVQRLAAFFPGMGEGKSAYRAGGWMEFASFTFRRADGSTIRIGTNPELTSWSEGRGDWAVQGDLERMLAALPWPIPTGDIAWGPPLNGIQLGIRFPKGRYAIGETLAPELWARNTTDKPLTWRYLEYPHWYSSVTFATAGNAGEISFKYGGHVSDEIILRTTLLEPGKEVKVRDLEARVLSNPPQGGTDLPNTLPVTIGKYQVLADWILEPLMQPGAPRWITGKTTIEVAAAEVPWGEAVDGVQLRLTPDLSAWNNGNDVGIRKWHPPGTAVFAEKDPVFKLEVRNLSAQAMRVNLHSFVLDCDGTIYLPFVGDKLATTEVKARESALIDLPLLGFVMPALKAGAHQIRVIQVAGDAKKAASNTVTVDMLHAQTPRLQIRPVLPPDDKSTPADELADPDDAGKAVRVASQVLFDESAFTSASGGTINVNAGFLVSTVFISFQFTPDGQARFAALTPAQRQQPVAVLVDGELMVVANQDSFVQGNFRLIQHSTPHATDLPKIEARFHRTIAAVLKVLPNSIRLNLGGAATEGPGPTSLTGDQIANLTGLPAPKSTGVSGAILVGGGPPRFTDTHMLEVTLDHARLKAVGLAVDDVRRALEKMELQLISVKAEASQTLLTYHRVFSEPSLEAIRTLTPAVLPTAAPALSVRLQDLATIREIIKPLDTEVLTAVQLLAPSATRPGPAVPLWADFQALLGKPIDAPEVKTFIERHNLKIGYKGDSGSFNNYEHAPFSLHFSKNTIDRVVLNFTLPEKSPLKQPVYAGPLPAGLLPADTPEDIIRRLGKPAAQPHPDRLVYEKPPLTFSFDPTTHRLAEIDLDETYQAPASQPADRLIMTSGIGVETMNRNGIADITAQQAKTLFDATPSRLRTGWEAHLPKPTMIIANNPPLPDLSKAAPPSSRDPRARVSAYDTTKLFISIYRPAGSILWHSYEDEIIEVMVPRSPELDKTFDLATLESTFGTIYRGLSQGDPRAKITQTLGNPENTEPSQAVNFSTLIYAGGAVRIQLWNDTIHAILITPQTRNASSTTRPATAPAPVATTRAAIQAVQDGILTIEAKPVPSPLESMLPPMLEITAKNSTNQAIKLDLLASQLVVNGQAQGAIGAHTGPLDYRWDALPPGEQISYRYSIPEDYWQRGVPLTVQWITSGHASNELMLPWKVDPSLERPIREALARSTANWEVAAYLRGLRLIGRDAVVEGLKDVLKPDRKGFTGESFEEQTRRDAISIVQQDKLAELVPELKSALRSNSPEVVKVGLLAIMSLDAGRTVDLAPLVGRGDAIHRRYLAGALGGATADRLEAISLLRKIIADEDALPAKNFEEHAFVKIWASQSLGRLNDHSGVPTLINLLEDRATLSYRGSIKGVLQEVTGQTFNTDQLWLDWWKASFDSAPK